MMFYYKTKSTISQLLDTGNFINISLHNPHMRILPPGTGHRQAADRAYDIEYRTDAPVAVYLDDMWFAEYRGAYVAIIEAGHLDVRPLLDVRKVNCGLRLNRAHEDPDAEVNPVGLAIDDGLVMKPSPEFVANPIRQHAGMVPTGDTQECFNHFLLVPREG